MENEFNKKGVAGSLRDEHARPNANAEAVSGRVVRRRFGRKPVPPMYDSRVPPDGGWGWVVTFGCFIGGVFTSLGLIVFSVILPELLVLYDTNNAVVSWIPTATLVVSHICAPIYTVIVGKINCRKSILLGGLLASFGISVSYFTESIDALILTYGVLTGFAAGLCGISFPIILSQYFRKYYGIASGILTASFAASRLLLTPAMQLLLEEYGCRSLFLITGALTLNVCVGACLCQPAKWHVYSVRSATARGYAEDRHDTNGHSNHQTKPLQSSRDANELQESRPGKNDDGNDHKIKIDSSTESINKEHVEMNDLKSDIVSATNRPIKSINDAIESEVTPYAVEELEKRSSAPSSGGSCVSRAFGGLDYALFGEPLFYALVANHVLFVTLMIYVPLFLFSFGLEIGLTPMESATIVSATAVGDIIGRVGGPLLVTALNFRVRYSMMAFSLTNGILILALSFCKSYAFCMAVSVTSGFLFGCVVGLNSVVIVDTMGSKRLPSVLGFTACVAGIFITPMAPFMGWIRDVTASYQNVYIFLCILQLLHFLLWTLKPFFVRSKKSKANAAN